MYGIKDGLFSSTILQRGRREILGSGGKEDLYSPTLLWRDHREIQERCRGYAEEWTKGGFVFSSTILQRGHREDTGET